MIQPTSLSGRCLSALREGPGTTRDVALETGLSSRKAGITLIDLHHRGHVVRVPLNKSKDKLGRVKAWLWSLAP
jgi:hypothetical protein